MNQDDSARKKAEKLVDFIIASDRLEGISTSDEDRATLIRVATGELPLETYLHDIPHELRDQIKSKYKKYLGHGLSEAEATAITDTLIALDDSKEYTAHDHTQLVAALSARGYDQPNENSLKPHPRYTVIKEDDNEN